MGRFTESTSDGLLDDLQGETTAELIRLSHETTLMALDALLASLPRGPHRLADAALEARVVARRMRLATEDFRATVDALD
ncbi:hypothetical protein [Oleisolibacter albus]|uniref:hypothetical protein n=1 Tax=Oleisolibacter albus TaxID=2171757 RepID=UPI000DF29738|nr:hypothetical protein [Oleisolibacter albus]